MLAGNRTYGCHVGTLAVEVNRDDRLCPGSDSASDLLGSINASSSRTSTMTGRAPVSDTANAVEAKVIASTILRRPHRFPARGRRGEVHLFRLQPRLRTLRRNIRQTRLRTEILLTKHKIASLDNPGDRCFDFIGDRLRLCLQIDQRYCRAKIWETAQEVQRTEKRVFPIGKFISSESAALERIREIRKSP